MGLCCFVTGTGFKMRATEPFPTHGRGVSGGDSERMYTPSVEPQPTPVGKNLGPGAWPLGAQIAILPTCSCVTVGKLISLSVPCFLVCKMGG